MNIEAVYRKSAKGQEELSTRTYHLPSRVRTLLIMFDGKSSAEDILGAAQNFADAESFFNQLLSEGFIEPVEGTAIGTAVDQGDTGEATRFAVNFLLNLLGPDADRLTLELEACKSAAELRGLVANYQTILKPLLGEKNVAAFAEGTLSRISE